MNETKTDNQAQEYAETIAAEMRNLETVLSGSDAEGYAEALAALGMNDRQEAEGDWFGLWATETALDLSVRVDTRGREYGTTVIVLRTVGGPRCEIVWDSHDASNVEVLCWWSSEIGRVRLTLPNFSARLEDA
mgnify:CR=1 FL=1